MNCALCQHPYETAKHLFFRCPITTNNINIVAQNQLTNIDISRMKVQEIMSLIYDKLDEKNFIHLSVIWWNIWYMRNKSIFENKPVTDVRQEAAKQIKDWNIANKLENKITNIRKRKNIQWTKPVEGNIKLIFDGSKMNNDHGSFGYILRDNQAKIVTFDYGQCGYTSVLHAEAFALRK